MSPLLLIAEFLKKNSLSGPRVGRGRSRGGNNQDRGRLASTEIYETRILPAAFPLVPRWTTTATNGSGLVQGQPTTLTWSFPADGVLTDNNPNNLNPNAPNRLITFLDTHWGAGPGGTDLTLRPWFQYFDQSLERLESVSGLSYVYSPADDGAPVRIRANQGVVGTRGDLRITGRAIDGDVGPNIGAQNYFPADGGDMIIDTDNISFFTADANDHRAFRNVLMHEFMHGVGLDHVLSSDSEFLMEKSPSVDNFSGPQLADILALQRHYGDSLERAGGDTFAAAHNFGTVSGGSSVHIGLLGDAKVVTGDQTDFVSIDDESDADFYRFTVDGASAVSLTLTPRGTTFKQGPYDPDSESDFNSKGQGDLTLTLLDSDGSTVLQSQNLTGVGVAESIRNFQLRLPGTYYVRVTSATADRVQLYGLDIDVATVSGAQIFGTVFNDVDFDGIQDSGEFGYSGVTVFLDQNSNGLLDSGEQSGLTDTQGRYGFTGLAEGTYSVREVLAPFRQHTTPATGVREISLSTNEVRMLVDFGSRLLGGTSGNDAFVLTYSSSTFDLSISIDGNPAFSMGTYPMNQPFTLRGNGGNDSVKITGTAGADSFFVTNSGLTINGSSLILDAVNSRNIEGGAGHDRYAFDADSQLGAYTLTESGNGGSDFIDFATTTAAVSLSLGATVSQTVNSNLKLTLNNSDTFEDVAGGSGEDILFGNSLANMIVGNAGRDDLTGGAGDDNLQGGGLHDRYLFDADTAQGIDTLTELVGGGSDILVFHGTTASINLNLGTAALQTVNSNLKLILNAVNTFEAVEGGAGNDVLTGNSLNNSMWGQQGNDILTGLSGSDYLSGGSSNDRFIFDADSTLGTDTLLDLSGIDSLDFSSTASGVSVHLGTTALQTVNSNLKLVLAESNRIETVVGGSGADNLIGNSLDNTMYGGAGDDILTGAEGNDSLFGGANNDSYLFSSSVVAEADQVTENPNDGTDTLDFGFLTTSVELSLATKLAQPVNANRTLKLNSAVTFENSISGSGADTLRGNSLNNSLSAGPGNDSLNGAAGNDVLLGGANNDTYLFGSSSTAEADQVKENPNEGTDTLNFSTLTTSILMNLAAISIQKVHTNRTLKLNSSIGFENFTAGSGADNLTGNALNNTLSGGSGDDTLIGAAGSDLLLGGANNDTYIFATAAATEADQVTESVNQGTDRLHFALLTTSVVLNLGSTSVQAVHKNRTLRLNSASSFENAVGGTGNDTLLGNAMANQLRGGAGANILVGQDGSDILVAGSGRDILIGGRGLDNLAGGNGDDILIAGRTTSDTSLSHLSTLRTAWIPFTPSATRIASLRSGVGSPLVSLKATINVLNDAGEDDSLSGQGNTDWFFRAVDDVLTDLFAGEVIDVV